MATIVIDPDGPNETIIESGRLDGGIDATKVHTGVSDWGARVAFDTTLKDRKGDRIHIDDGDFFFRGFLTDIETTQSAGTAETTVGGLGVEHDLERNDAEKQYKNILVHDALDDYFSNETGFTPTVTPQTADETVTDEQTQEASTDSEWLAIVEDNLDDSDPFHVSGGAFQLAQSGFFERGVLDLQDSNGTNFVTPSGHSDSGAQRINELGDWLEYEFGPLNYDLPAAVTIPTVVSGLSYAFRVVPEDEANAPEVTVTLSGNDGSSQTLEVLERDWPTSNSFTWYATTQEGWQDLREGVTYTIRFEITEAAPSNQYIDVDAAWVGDRRFAYDFDNTVASDGDPLDGPQNFPDSAEFVFDLAASTWNITDATLTTTWNNTTDNDGNQRIQLRLNDQTWFPSDGTEADTASVTTDFGSEVGISIQGRVRMGRLGTGGSDSPATGFNGQQINSWDISIDGNDIPCINDKTYEGSDMDIVQELAREGRMRWHAPHRRDSKPVEVYPDGGNAQAKPDWTVISTTRRDSVEGAANHITVRGAKDDAGNRIKVTVEDAASIAADGQEHFDALRPRAETAVEVERLARQILKRKLRDFNVTATREIASIDLAAGPAYPVTLPDGTEETIPSEEVHYSVEAGDVTGRVRFDLGALRLENQLGGAQSNLRDTQLSF